VHKRIISAVKRVEFVSDRMSYMILRGRWCHIIVLNVHAPAEDTTDLVKDSFYEKLESAFDKFPKKSATTCIFMVCQGRRERKKGGNIVLLVLCLACSPTLKK
jgi:hypothetical protein